MNAENNTIQLNNREGKAQKKIETGKTQTGDKAQNRRGQSDDPVEQLERARRFIVHLERVWDVP